MSRYYCLATQEILVVLPFCALFYLSLYLKIHWNQWILLCKYWCYKQRLSSWLVCKALLFCVVKSFHGMHQEIWQFSFTDTHMKTLHQRPKQEQISKAVPKAKGSSVTWHSWLQPFIHCWCSLSLTTASSLLWSPRMSAWCSTRGTPRSPRRAPCAASSAAATPNPPTRECSYSFGIGLLCQYLCFLLEDLV